MKRTAMVVLILLLFSFGYSKKIAVLPELLRPGVLEIIEDKMFILDRASVNVYSIKDFRFLYSFGKNGQGPGELVYSPTNEIKLQMQVFNRQIVLNSQTKIIFFSLEGKMIKELSLKFMCIQIVPVGKHFAVVKIGFEETGGLRLNALLFDSNLKELKTLDTWSEKEKRRRRKILIPPPYFFIYQSEGKFFVSGSNQSDFIIQVYSENGDLLNRIKKPYQKFELNMSWKMKIINWLKGNKSFQRLPDEIKKLFTFQDCLPAIRDLMVEGNRIFVQTYKEHQHRSEFYVLDLKGRLLKKIFLPQSSGNIIKFDTNRTYTFSGQKYYYLVENEDLEQWELHMEIIPE